MTKAIETNSLAAKDLEEPLHEKSTKTSDAVTNDLGNDSLNASAPESPFGTQQLQDGFASPLKPSEITSRSFNVWETPSRFVAASVVVIKNTF